MRKMIVNDFTISDNSDCFVIAEIGNNHQGELQKALEMFKAAKECGVDAVKLQKRNNKSLLTKAAYDKPYDNENSFGTTYGAHREALEFGKNEYIELKKYADEIGLTMFATAFDMNSADFLAELDMPLYKVASGDLKNTPLLKHIARIGKPMIISTGGGTMEDVQRAYDAIMPINKQLAILQCTASYPAEPQDLNLRVISTYREKFPDVVIGLSDHENGIAMAIAAYVLGSRMVEQHFTLNHTWKGTDHAFSLEPIGMKKLVRDLRRVKIAMGDGEKRIYPSEINPIHKMGKKLVAARNLKVGHELTYEDIAIKSPGDGIPPYELDNLIGRKINSNLLEDQDISFEDLK
ncbi:MAG: N-acetylneuraminate synthase family protein [Anaerolineales bacterium]|jgi:sialic acid synthase|nr:N-acetylneuraminate synthase family protein [Anaerolineales bacterium]